ncbi:hypothetical protein LTR94_033649, partial [Friedmanniomyces endolithicus]
DASARRRLLSQDQAQQAALSCPGRADDRHERSGGDVQVDALQNDLVAIFDPDVAQTQDRAQCPPPCAQGNSRRLRKTNAASIVIASSAIHAT